jgi:hypothetical protein
MHHAKLISSLMVFITALSQNHDDSFSSPTIYRSIVGSLQYLSFIKLDLSFIVTKVYQFMHWPTIVYYNVIKRIFLYLRRTPHHSLFLIQWSTSHLFKLFLDFDWSSFHDDSHFTTSYCLFWIKSYLIELSRAKGCLSFKH